MLYNAVDYNDEESPIVKNCKSIVEHMYEMLRKIDKSEFKFKVPQFDPKVLEELYAETSEEEDEKEN